jgi:hypothetical protein
MHIPANATTNRFEHVLDPAAGGHYPPAAQRGVQRHGPPILGSQ